MKRTFVLSIILLFLFDLQAQTRVWSKHEIQFESSKTYDNPVYDVREFRIEFTAPSGRKKVVRGFWDGGTDWKVRLLPDETGTWKWETECSDKENKGLHDQNGAFECVPNNSENKLFQKGAIQHEPGKYYLSFNDGTPFFWLACTAWNGALKSTDEEWEHYLSQRKENNYNHWISVVKSPDDATILAYIPEKTDVEFYNPEGIEYSARWFNPVSNQYSDAVIEQKNHKIAFTHNFENDMLIILKEK